MPGPGPVAIVHRIFIATALIAAVGFTGWEVVRWARTDDPLEAVGAVLAAAAAVALAFYLRSLRGLAARLTPGRPETRR
jgi:hypothetical protein